MSVSEDWYWDKDCSRNYLFQSKAFGAILFPNMCIILIKKNVNTYSIKQESANFFCKGPKSKYIRYYRLYGFCHNYSTLAL